MPLAFVIGLVVSTAACGTIDSTGDRQQDSEIGTVSSSVSPSTQLGQSVATGSPGSISTTTPATPVSTLETEGPTPGIAEDAACDALIMGSTVMFESIDELAWFSHQVVVGTVAERLPAAKVSVEGSALPFTIVRDVRIVIEQQFRGQAGESVWVRTLGGKIGDCLQEYPESPQLEPGDRVLVFLRQVAGVDTDVYEFLGNAQGHWLLSANNVVTTYAAHLLPTGVPVPLEVIEAAIVAALADGPPVDSALADYFLVSEQDSPIAPIVTATATTTP